MKIASHFYFGFFPFRTKHYFSSFFIATNTVGTKKDGLSGQFFRIFEIKSFCFVVAIFDL